MSAETFPSLFTPGARTAARPGRDGGNPTEGPMSDHLPTPESPDRAAKAVALDYDPARAPTPRVVASGRGAVAEQILQIALAHGVKVREDADLVEILAALEIDSLIPLEAFAAVAEILAYVYRAEGRSVPPAHAAAPPDRP